MLSVVVMLAWPSRAWISLGVDALGDEQSGGRVAPIVKPQSGIEREHREGLPQTRQGAPRRTLRQLPIGVPVRSFASHAGSSLS